MDLNTASLVNILSSNHLTRHKKWMENVNMIRKKFHCQVLTPQTIEINQTDKGKPGVLCLLLEPNTHFLSLASSNEETVLPPSRDESTIDPNETSQPSDDAEKKKTEEKPKIISKRSRMTATRIFFQFHFIPFSVALALIALNLRTAYVSGEDGPWSNMLQFASKAHELLMQISIGTVVVTYIEYLATQQTALPFGAIFAAYSTMRLDYLWSDELTASLTSPGFLLSLKVAFGAFMPASILLAAGVGPASAIAMLPRYVNFTMPIYSMVFEQNYTEQFPTELTLSTASPSTVTGFANVSSRMPLLQAIKPSANY